MLATEFVRQSLILSFFMLPSMTLIDINRFMILVSLLSPILS